MVMMSAAIRSAVAPAPHPFPPKALWRFMLVERNVGTCSRIGRADHPFALACDRREIDPASAVSRHSARPDRSRSSRTFQPT